MQEPGRGRGHALARAALAGNPSDGYGGAVLAVTLPVWRAEAWVQPGQPPAMGPSNPLVEATIARFAREHQPAARGTAVGWRTTIPRNVGLGGSSAIVIAVTRALCAGHEMELEPGELAEFALAVETEELGIAAGLQDRVVQAFEGLVFMDLAQSPSRERYERLDGSLLPPLLIAWRRDAAGESGHVHDGLRARHAAGETAVTQAMAELADCARAAREAVLAGRIADLCACVDRTFDLRRDLLALDPRCTEMVVRARAAGAAANYTGSGGAVVVLSDDSDRLTAAQRALHDIGCPTVVVGCVSSV